VEPRLEVVTLAVADLERSLAFYCALGLESNGIVGADWTDEVTGANGAVAMFKLEGGLLLNLYPRVDLAKDAAIPVGRHLAPGQNSGRAAGYLGGHGLETGTSGPSARQSA
jgi:uncharacterized protein